MYLIQVKKWQFKKVLNWEKSNTYTNQTEHFKNLLAWAAIIKKNLNELSHRAMYQDRTITKDNHIYLYAKYHIT